MLKYQIKKKMTEKINRVDIFLALAINSLFFQEKKNRYLSIIQFLFLLLIKFNLIFLN